MNEQVVHDRPALPPGTYYISALLVGSDKIYGQSLRMQWHQPMSPEQLGFVAGANASGLVADDLAGVSPGMWWLFQVLVFDAWGRSATMSQQVAVDRSLTKEELPAEMARISPDAVAGCGESIVKLLTSLAPRRPREGAWPSSLATH